MTTATETSPATQKALNFIDVFAGCGGLSLGLMQAGWEGIFAIEHDQFAFQTLKRNLLSTQNKLKYSWPEWIPQTSHNIYHFLDIYKPITERLSGKVDMIVGGPPCQGFSSAGKRKGDDPRNKLVEAYVEFVDAVSPKAVLIENVKGITSNFKTSEDSGTINYSEKIISELSKKYNVFSKLLDLSTFGVPQNRHRFFIIAIRKDLKIRKDPFDAIERARAHFLREKSITAPVSAKSAISDFETATNGTQESRDTKGFREISYVAPKTSYQRLMNCSISSPSNTRLANHRTDIICRFQEIIKACHEQGRLNTSLSTTMRDKYGLKKKAIRVLDPFSPSPTITSMPDDLIHYSEPRTLTVRENARLQSFPDWYEFEGKYTSGGHRRKKEIPRFTQVANAVPPLAAEAIGSTLRTVVSKLLEIKSDSDGVEFQTALESEVYAL